MPKRQKNILYICLAIVILALAYHLLTATVGYDGYCQKQYSYIWIPDNQYQCSFLKFITTPNSHDFTMYANIPIK
jgi:hypothetical protein